MVGNCFTEITRTAAHNNNVNEDKRYKTRNIIQVYIWHVTGDLLRAYSSTRLLTLGTTPLPLLLPPPKCLT